jgi:D-3-phosphoglycerate dehydrogenase / 2-oxoglutarate reductase
VIQAPTDGKQANQIVISLGPVPRLVTDRIAPVGTVVELASAVLADYGGSPEDVVALLVRGNAPVDAEMITGLPSLQVIARTGVGVDLVDVAAATARGIPVAITAHAGTRAVAEGAFAMILHLVKRLGPYTELVRSNRWSERESTPPGDLDGATLGVVGLGRIGSRVAEIGRQFGMEIVAHDLYVNPNAARGAGIALLELSDLVSESDVITLHVPLTDESRNLVDYKLLSHCKPGAILVNTSRGGLVDLDSAYAALCDGTLAGLGLDVYEPEPPDVSHPIFNHPNIVLTPHMLGLSLRAGRQTFEEAADNIKIVLSGGRPPAVANPEVYIT